MRNFFRFLSDHVVPSLVILFSALLALGGGILDALQLGEWLFPKYWLVFGLAIFFLAIVWVLSQLSPSNNASRKNLETPAPAKEQTSIWNPEGLYVGEIQADVRRLSDDLVMEISIRVFNATGASINIRNMRGYIGYRDSPGAQTESEVKLPMPQYLPDRSPVDDRPNLGEAFIVLAQHVSRETAQKIHQQIESREIPYFRLASLDLIAYPTDTPRRPPHGEEVLTARLPLWSGFTLRRDTERVVTGRVIEGHVKQVIGATAVASV